MPRKKSTARLDAEITAALAKKRPLRCPNCAGGLKLDDPSYGLTCPRCEARVSEPFDSAHDIPDYVQAPSAGTVVATIRFKSARSRHNYLTALRARLPANAQVDDMLQYAFPAKESVGRVYGRGDAQLAADVAAEINGVTAELGRTT